MIILSDAEVYLRLTTISTIANEYLSFVLDSSKKTKGKDT